MPINTHKASWFDKLLISKILLRVVTHDLFQCRRM